MSLPALRGAGAALRVSSLQWVPGLVGFQNMFCCHSVCTDTFHLLPAMLVFHFQWCCKISFQNIIT